MTRLTFDMATLADEVAYPHTWREWWALLARLRGEG